MKTKFELSKVVVTIEHAFLPLECVVKLIDHDETLSICVFDSKNKRVLKTSFKTMRLRDPDGLQKFVYDSRKCVERDGFELQPWQLPS